jgi:hypothetical protein
MSRGLTAAFLTAADAGTVYPAILCNFDFSGGQINTWTGTGNLVYGGLTYSGIGDQMGMSAIEETEHTQANGVSFTLNGIPSANVSSIFNQDYRNRVCTVQLALFASLTATTPITAPAVMFVGRMDQALMDDDGETATINLTAESRLIDLQRPRARRYTDEDQQAVYSGDLGLEYVAGLQDKELMWGANSN